MHQNLFTNTKKSPTPGSHFHQSVQNSPQDKDPQPSQKKIHEQPIKINPFMMPSIHHPKNQTQSNINQQKQSMRHQTSEKPIISRQAYKKLHEMKPPIRKKKVRSPQLKKRDLSLIHQTDSEQYFTQSQESSMSDSNFSDQGFQLETSQYWNNDKLNYESEQSLQDADELNKTVVMTKKRYQRQNEYQVVEQRIEHQTKLNKLLDRYSVKQLHNFFKHGQIESKDYEQILKLSKQRSMKAKQEIFYKNLDKNLDKIQKNSDIILNNYVLILQRLQKDIFKIEIKLKQMTNAKHQYLLCKQNKPNPEIIKFQLKIYEKTAQKKAKTQFLQSIEKCLNQFKTKYQELINELIKEKNSKQSCSQNISINKLVNFLKLGRSVYGSILSSLKKDKETNMSLIDKKIKQLYLGILEQKYHKQIKQYDQMIRSQMVYMANSLYIQKEKSQELFNLLKIKSYKIVDKKLNLVRNKFQQNITWVKIIKQKGELKWGRIYKNAIELIKTNPSTQLSIQEYEQQILIQQGRFYMNRIMRQYLLYQSDIIEQLYLYVESNKSKCQIIIKKQKYNNLVSKIQIIEKQLQIFQSVIKYKLSSQYGRQYGQKKSDNYKRYLNQRCKNVSILQQRTKKVLEQKQTLNIHQCLIPKKYVIIYDFIKNQSKQNKQNNKLDNKSINFTILNDKQNIKSQQNKQTKQQWKNIFNSMKNKNQNYPSNQYYQIKIHRDNIQNYNQNYTYNNQSTYQSDHQIKTFIKQQKQTSLQQQQAKQQHFNQVYQLILNNQIQYPQPQKKQLTQPYQPQQYLNTYDFLSSIKLSSTKPTIDQSFLIHYAHPKNIFNQNHQSASFVKNHNQHWFNPSQSLQDIETACQLFAKDFYTNSKMRQKIDLNDKQFYFLMSPEYRKYFLDKKSKDKQLTDNIINMIHQNISQMNNVIQNPIKYMMQVDPYFQQKVYEYQYKILNNEQSVVDPFEPILVYDFDDLSTRDSSSQVSLLDRRVKQIEQKRISDQFNERNYQYGGRDSQYNYEDFLYID